MDQDRDARFVQEALRIVELGQKEGIPFRLLGAIAFKMHCPVHRHLFEGMDRPLTDIDFVTYSKFRPQMRKFFTALGYTPFERLIASPMGQHRHIYWSEEHNWQVDIFFDVLRMCHNVDFRGRLELDKPTIPLPELVLEKMQIVQINPKDIKDTTILFLEHEVGQGEADTIDGAYIAQVLAQDWGYYYTVTTNLRKVQSLLGEFEALTDKDRKKAGTRIEALLGMIEKAPKSLKWKARAQVGPKVRWYNVVEEVFH